MTRRHLMALAAASGGASAMASAPELCLLSAVELSRRLRRRKVSAREVLDAHLEQIARVNPKVNAIVTLVPEVARAAAMRADEAAARGQFLGPLHGLPVAHKDLQETKGIRTTFGSPLFRDYVPQQNSLLIDRIQQAGAITLGKTNTPEFGAGSQTFNPVFGATRNPYDVARTCGGSSGGAAVALACGMVPIADGSDTGGSLRNPAAFCGITGFRVSPGRVPSVSAGWSPLSTSGPMARSVADVALFLSAIAGPDPRAPLSRPEPGGSFAQPLERNLKGARVAWCANFAGLPFDKRISTVFAAARKHFLATGCAVEEAEPDLTGADEIFRVFRALSFYQQHGAKVAQHRAQVKDTVIEEVELGARLTGSRIAEAEANRVQLYGRVVEFLRRFEYFVLPTTQVPPFPVDQPWVTEIDGVQMGNYIDWMRSCYYITVTGLPAISVPAGYTPEGLPVGLQIAGRPHDDWGVLQIAHAFETAAAVRRWPSLAAG